MISIDKLSFSFGGRDIYKEASLHIKPGDRIGLVGRNGTGKSTLLRIITGEYAPDAGSVSMSNAASIGFLNQDLLSFQSEEPILKVALQAFDALLKKEKEIEQLIQTIESDPSEENIHKLSQLQEEFQKKGGYEMESRAEASLEMLGFSTAQLQQPLNRFSGGWRMRVMLAKLLLEAPSLLMLDEPTNHLDLPTIEWLEEYLVNYEGALIIVSHDREFLNKIVNRVVETGRGSLTAYTGNIDQYQKEKEEREAIQQNAYENQQKFIKDTERFIERFRAKSTKASQVQSRIKMLEKMEKVEALEDDAPVMQLRFKPKTTSGKEVLYLQDFSKAYGELEVFAHSNLEINRGDKIALVGANGKGKSTLLRMVYGNEEFDGRRKVGHNVDFAFYAQHQLEALSLDNSIFQELRQCGAERTDLELRTVLGAFLFSGEEIEKPIRVLSGGEKARVALAKMLVSDANFLLLDEPTNHLDAVSVDMLIDAMEHFEGTFLTVSHSRHFIREVANKIWYIEDKELKEYPGTWKEYDWWRKQKKKESTVDRSAQPGKTTGGKNKKSGSGKSNNKLSQGAGSYSEPSKKLQQLENKILDLEMAKEEKEAELAQAAQNQPDTYQSLNEEHAQLTAELEQLTKEWEQLVEE